MDFSVGPFSVFAACRQGKFSVVCHNGREYLQNGCGYPRYVEGDSVAKGTRVASDGVVGTAARKQRISVGGSVIGIIGEILLTVAVLCGLYIVWQLWWTGVVSEQEQNSQIASSSWVTPGSVDGSYKVAQPQKGDPPVLPDNAPTGAVLGQMYIPRFSHEYKRLIVQGTSLEQLNRHGLGHYSQTPMFGAIGNVAIAGHREGYGSPLGDVLEFRKGDAVVIRTQQYWYVYTFQSYRIVLPNDVSVILPVPGQPNARPTQRLLTMTTCTPRYGTPTHRWVGVFMFKYWAYVKDGIPEELATDGANGSVSFPASADNWSEYIPPLPTLVEWLAAAYVAIFLAAAFVWKWPQWRIKEESASMSRMPQKARVQRRRRGLKKARKQRTVGLYGTLLKLQPGVAAIRWILLLILMLIGVLALFQWVYPWLSENVPYLRETSNYVAATTAVTP